MLLGTNLGSVEGPVVGKNEGLSLEIFDGYALSEGLADGSSVGASVGSADGNALWNFSDDFLVLFPAF